LNNLIVHGCAIATLVLVFFSPVLAGVACGVGLAFAIKDGRERS
jgi:hypothetical protein